MSQNDPKFMPPQEKDYMINLKIDLNIDLNEIVISLNYMSSGNHFIYRFHS